MASVDEIFKRSGASSGKRKLDAILDPAEIYKSTKLSHRGRDERRSGNFESSNDGPTSDSGVQELPDDDDEGRFFGGGVTKLEEEMLDFVDGQDDGTAPTEPIDEAWLKKAALALDRCIGKNAELRAKFEHDPQRFISSEADLDAQIKELSVLSEFPQLFDSLVRRGCAQSLVGLLSHENTDISIDVIELFTELTSDDVAAEESQWNHLVDGLLDADLVDLLVSNLSRLNEEDESDRNGVYHILSMLENLCSRNSISERLGQHAKLLRWLLDRSGKSESPVSQNKQYSTEILAILAQASVTTRQQLVDMDATDTLLQLAAAYRRSDPEKGSDEEEYMQDLFDILTCIADEPEGKAKFLDAEGIELCLIMLREGHMSKQPALRLLDHALGGVSGGEVCQRLVGLGGLKPIFTIFMKKRDRVTLQHLLEIFSSLLRSLPPDCPERIRTLAKFMENDYEKTAKLIQIRRDYAAMVAEEDAKIAGERKAAVDLLPEEMAVMEMEWEVRRMESGLFMQQTVDVILAWLAAEDDGANKEIGLRLAKNGEGISEIKQSLTSQLKHLTDDGPENQDKRDMLVALIDCLG